MTLYEYPCNSSETCHPIKITLESGVYFIELWGAQGGNGCTDNAIKLQYYGGRGSYVAGNLRLYERRSFFLFIGGHGNAPSNCSAKNPTAGGYNGGGAAGFDTHDNDNSGSGGGSTDIRLDENDITSRIIVAAGGSGSTFDSFGAPGGDLTGYSMKCKYRKTCIEPSSTNQTSGFDVGIGADGYNSGNVPDSGAGGGYYGVYRGRSEENISELAVSSSGSSFISGYPGCNSMNKLRHPTGSPIHYSNFVFTKPVMYNGNKTFLSPIGELEEGHIGNGAIKITRLFCYNFKITCNANYFAGMSISMMLIILFIVMDES